MLLGLVEDDRNYKMKNERGIVGGIAGVILAVMLVAVAIAVFDDKPRRTATRFPTGLIEQPAPIPPDVFRTR